MPLIVKTIKFTEDQLDYLKRVEREERLSGFSQAVKRIIDTDRDRRNGRRKKR